MRPKSITTLPPVKKFIPCCPLLLSHQNPPTFLGCVVLSAVWTLILMPLIHCSDVMLNSTKSVLMKKQCSLIISNNYKMTIQWLFEEKFPKCIVLHDSIMHFLKDVLLTKTIEAVVQYVIFIIPLRIFSFQYYHGIAYSSEHEES